MYWSGGSLCVSVVLDAVICLCAPAGVETSQGVPGVCVWGTAAGRPAAQPLSVWALRASQHGAASPSAAPVTAGLLVQLPSHRCRGPQTKVMLVMMMSVVVGGVFLWHFSKESYKVLLDLGPCLPNFDLTWLSTKEWFIFSPVLSE